MKKITVILLAVFMLFGFSTAASAAFDLSFNIDFHTDGLSNPVHSYLSGDYNTGETIQLEPCESVWVDFYVDVLETDPVTAALFTLSFDPANLEATDIQGGPFPWAPMSSNIQPGSAYLEEGYLAINPVGLYGTDNLFASILLHCTGVGLDPLYFDGTFASFATVPNLIIDPVVVGTIENVPVPGALWLLGSGLIGLVGLRRRVK